MATTVYKKHGKTSSAKRYSGQKLKVNDGDCWSRRRIVSKQNTELLQQTVTANFNNIHLEVLASTKANHRELHKANILERVAISKTLITDTKKKQNAVMIIKRRASWKKPVEAVQVGVQKYNILQSVIL